MSRRRGERKRTAAVGETALFAGPDRWRRLLIGHVLLGLGQIWLPAAARSEPLPSFQGLSGRFVEERPKAPAPPIRFLDDGGRVRSLDDFSGLVRLVTIWATWCPPCIREMPALDRLQRYLGPTGLQVVPLALDARGAAAVLPFYARTGLRWLPVFLDPVMASVYTQEEGPRDEALPLYGLPVSFFVDRGGRLVGYLVGAADWDAPGPRALLTALLGPEG